jgi:hypothetical protein
MLEAFVACGGDPDKGGFVSRDNLINIGRILITFLYYII